MDTTITTSQALFLGASPPLHNTTTPANTCTQIQCNPRSKFPRWYSKTPTAMCMPSWMHSHQVEDPGPEAAQAGMNLLENQMPHYAQQVADSMDKYLTAGAANAAAQARLANAVADEIQAVKPEPEGELMDLGNSTAPEGTPAPGVVCEYTGFGC